MEVEAPGVVRTLGRGRPVVAAEAHVAHAFNAGAGSRRRQADTVTVGSGDLVAAAGPTPLARFFQFFTLSDCWQSATEFAHSLVVFVVAIIPTFFFSVFPKSSTRQTQIDFGFSLSGQRPEQTGQ